MSIAANGGHEASAEGPMRQARVDDQGASLAAGKATPALRAALYALPEATRRLSQQFACDLARSGASTGHGDRTENGLLDALCTELNERSAHRRTSSSIVLLLCGNSSPDRSDRLSP
mmetsp:Transcript_123146/g.394383  ORF Transcript_123146/g.394383 Transcript_123146/m.394383 type:complete len:117 (+) Transcript_123146:148-498(+)